MTASVSPGGEECISLSSLFPHSLILHSSPISREKGDGKLKMEQERDNFGLVSLPHSNREIFSPPCPLSGKKNKENCNSAVFFAGKLEDSSGEKRRSFSPLTFFPFPTPGCLCQGDKRKNRRETRVSLRLWAERLLGKFVECGSAGKSGKEPSFPYSIPCTDCGRREGRRRGGCRYKKGDGLVGLLFSFPSSAVGGLARRRRRKGKKE